MNKAIETVVFKADETEYAMNIHDVEGNRWIPSDQVGQALGTSRIRAIVSELTERGEIFEGKHFCTLTVRNSTRGNPNIMALSYRGIIRVSMRSEGRRAIQFRDWAEDVLYSVMTTGSYTAPGSGANGAKQLKEACDIIGRSLKISKHLGHDLYDARVGSARLAMHMTGMNLEEWIEKIPKTSQKKSDKTPQDNTSLAQDFFKALSSLSSETLSEIMEIKKDRMMLRLVASVKTLSRYGHRFEHEELKKALKEHPAYLGSNVSIRGNFGGEKDRSVFKVWVFDVGIVQKMVG